MSILCSSEDQGKNPLQAAIDEYAAIKKLKAEASARRKLEASEASKDPEECMSDSEDEGECTSDSDDERGMRISLSDSDDGSTSKRSFRHPKSLSMGTRLRTVKRHRFHRLQASKKTETVLEHVDGAESSSGQTPSDDAEIFTPELIQEDDKYKDKNTYRFVCPHAGQFQCSLTSLVFVMDGEGELLYRVVSWDPRLLDGLGQMQPAGPLYDVKCFNGSISKLHLPHCEIFSEGDNMDGLAVAHFTGGNMEIVQPITVTETHVMIDIRDLSLFGLLWMKIFSHPISGQVLLFLRTLPVEEEEEEEKILNVHLLPGNVPVSEVVHSHQDKKYIETTSKCHLFLEREYSLRCQPENCEVQPKSEIFEHNNFGPNFHPSFQVFLSVDVKKVGLTILDKAEDCKEVWSRPRVSLKAPSQGVEPPEHRMISGSEFVDALRGKLIQRVSSVMAIADSLKSKHMITDELYSELHNADTNQRKMRCLFMALDSGGASVKAEFYRLLKKNEPHLVEELESGHSKSFRRQ